jgi:hypothetical protein
MRSAPVERSPALGRVLADAERAAWGGDPHRARGLLRLAERLAGGSARADLLVAAESVRFATAAAGSASPVTSRAAPVVDLRRLPRLRAVAEQAALRDPLTSLPPQARAGGLDTRTASRSSPAGRVGHSRAGAQRRPCALRWRVLACVCGVALVAYACLGDASARFATYAIAAGAPDLAISVLSEARGGGELLLRGDARLALGDTAGAVLDYVGAADAPMPNGRVAWIAGERLGRLSGRHQAAAESMLRAYVLGIEPDRWPRIADALERAGRHAEARRVREGTAR